MPSSTLMSSPARLRKEAYRESHGCVAIWRMEESGFGVDAMKLHANVSLQRQQKGPSTALQIGTPQIPGARASQTSTSLAHVSDGAASLH
jgi:hypothetical protein